MLRTIKINSLPVLLPTLICLTILSSCKSPAEKAQTKLDQEAAAKKTQEAQASKKALEELESEAQGNKFAALAPPVQEAEAPYIKGKVIFIYKRAENKSEFLLGDRPALGEIYASNLAEVKTVVQINCFNIPDGQYINEKTKEKIPAFSVRCDVDVIDTIIPAVIARKQFENTQLPDKTVLKPTDKEIIAPSPYKDIQTFIRNLPRK